MSTKKIQGSLFVPNANTIKTCIVQIIRSIRKAHTCEHLSQNVADEIICFVKVIKDLLSKFITVCLQAFSEGNRQSRNFYFCLLWYSAIFPPRLKNIDVDMETLGLKQKKEAFRKLYCSTETDERDFSCLRLGLFRDLCFQKNESSEHAVHPSRPIHHLFSFEGCMPYLQKVSKVWGKWRWNKYNDFDPPWRNIHRCCGDLFETNSKLRNDSL